MKKLIVFIFFLPIAVSAQNLKLGFDFEIHQIRISSPTYKGIMGGNGAPLSYHLNLGVGIIDPLIFQIKVGRTLHVEFCGWELGLNGSYKFYEPFYLKVGVLHHSNEGGVGSNTFSVSYASILMFHFGVGAEVAKFLSIYIDYYLPTSKEVIVWRGLFEKEPQTFEKMIRLGFIFGWEL